MANPGQDEDSEANAETAAELAARGVNPHEVSP
jgi:hypothetical protein